MRCAICCTELAEDAAYRMYIPMPRNGNEKGPTVVDRRVCFHCHFGYEYFTGIVGRVERNGTTTR